MTGPCRDKRFVMRFERNDISPIRFVDGDEPRPHLPNSTYETTSVEFDIRKCERTLRRVWDEVERIRSKNYTCDEVVVPKRDYARLFAIAAKDAPHSAKPSHANVEALVGVDITVVDRGTIQAVRDDPRRAVSEWAFDDGEDE